MGIHQNTKGVKVKHYTITATIALACAIWAQSARAEPEVRLGFVYNVSEPQILDVDTVSALGTNISSLFHFGTAKLVYAAEPCGEETGKRNLECAVLRLGVALPLYFYLDGALATTVHEYGHFRAFSRLGAGMNEFMLEHVRTGTEEPATPLTVFLFSLRARLKGKSLGDSYGVNVTQERLAKIYSREPYRSHLVETSLFMYSGGVNQSQYAAERMARAARKGNAHPLDGIAFLHFWKDAKTYSHEPNDDIGRYISLLNMRGLATSFREIQEEAQHLKFFSGSLLSFAWSGIRWITNGNETVSPLSLRVGNLRLFWPEFASYLTVYGPTKKADAEVRWEESAFALSFHLGGEESLADLIRTRPGNPKYAPAAEQAHLREHTAGAGIERGAFVASIHLTRNEDTGGAWREADVSYRFGLYTASIVGYYGKGYSFAREIKGQIPYFARNEELGAKLFFELSFPYR